MHLYMKHTNDVYSHNKYLMDIINNKLVMEFLLYLKKTNPYLGLSWNITNN